MRIFIGTNVIEGGPHPVVSVLNQRNDQQDAALVSDTCCAVADGMGGHADGAAASVGALTVLAEYLTGPARAGIGHLTAAIGAANDAVRALSDGGFRNPGTTLVAVVPSPDGRTVQGAWVGDSRAYLVDGSSGVVTPLTIDHAGASGGLTRALGDHGWDIDAKPQMFEVAVGHGHRILLCTDGVSGPFDNVYDEEDDSTLAAYVAAGLEQLVTHAAANGHDNATAVLVDVDTLAAAHAPTASK